KRASKRRASRSARAAAGQSRPSGRATTGTGRTLRQRGGQGDTGEFRSKCTGTNVQVAADRSSLTRIVKLLGKLAETQPISPRGSLEIRMRGHPTIPTDFVAFLLLSPALAGPFLPSRRTPRDASLPRKPSALRYAS